MPLGSTPGQDMFVNHARIFHWHVTVIWVCQFVEDKTYSGWFFQLVLPILEPAWKQLPSQRRAFSHWYSLEKVALVECKSFSFWHWKPGVIAKRTPCRGKGGLFYSSNHPIFVFVFLLVRSILTHYCLDQCSERSWVSIKLHIAAKNWTCMRYWVTSSGIELSWAGK